MLKLIRGVLAALCLLAVTVWAQDPVAEKAPANGAEAAMAQAPDDAAAIATVFTNGVAAGTGPVYQLDQFGPVGSKIEATATFEKASKDIIAAGGGIVIIPAKAAAGWYPAARKRRTICAG